MTVRLRSCVSESVVFMMTQPRNYDISYNGTILRRDEKLNTRVNSFDVPFIIVKSSTDACDCK